MSLKISPNIPIKSYNQPVSKTADYTAASFKADSFEPSFGRKEDKPSLFQKIFRRGETQNGENEQTQQPYDFAERISQGIKAQMGKSIPASNFRNIMSPEEFKAILPSLQSDNFLRTPENIENGIYSVDLDYQSNFSNGNENVFELLDKVAQYADEYTAKQEELQRKNAAAGLPVEEIKPFVFALCDRDCVEGLQHAVRIIGSNPEKFKNVKFVPAIKLTFAHKAPKSAIGFENSEMLVYGINPFSTHISEFVDKIINKRKQMVLNFIKDINQLYPEFSYNVFEFAEQNQLKYLRNYTVSNLYWRAREYAEKKGGSIIKGSSVPPETILKDASMLLSELGNIQTGSTRRGFSQLGSDLITKDSDANKTIAEVFRKYSTHPDENTGQVVSEAENLYESMIECLTKEEPHLPVLAISAPIYLADYFGERNAESFEKIVEFIKDLQENSGGMLCAFESIVPSYGLDPAVTKSLIKEFNNYMRKHTNLYEVGGSFAGIKAN